MARFLAVIVAMVGLLAERVHAGSPSEALDAYALFASEGLRVNSLVVKQGDVGVNDGLLLISGAVAAKDSQVVATHARLGRKAICGQLFANQVDSHSGCQPALPFSGPVIADVATACGFPSTFPTCDPGTPVTVAAGERKELAPGVYGDVLMKRGAAALVLQEGSYVFCNVAAGKQSRVELAVDTQMSVTGNARLGTVAFGGALGSDARIMVDGSQVQLAGNTEVPHLCAPHGNLKVGKGLLTGRFVARQIKGKRVSVSMPPSAPSVTTTSTTTTTVAATTATTSSSTTTAPSTTSPSTTAPSTTTPSTTTAPSTSSSTSTAPPTTAPTTTLPPSPAWVQDLVQTAQKQSGSTSLAVSVSGVTAGHSIIAFFVMDPTSGPVTCTDNAGNTYSADVDTISYTSATSGVRTVIFAAHNVAAPTTITVTHPAVAARSLSVSEFKNISTLDVWNANGGNNAAPSSSATPVLAQSPELVIAAVGVDGTQSTTFTPIDPVSEPAWIVLPRASSRTSGTISVFPEYKVVSVQKQYNAAGTLSSSKKWGAAIAAYR